SAVPGCVLRRSAGIRWKWARETRGESFQETPKTHGPRAWNAKQIPEFREIILRTYAGAACACASRTAREAWRRPAPLPASLAWEWAEKTRRWARSARRS